MKKLFLFFALVVNGFPAITIAANTFDPATNTLTLDAVTTGGIKYPNVVVRLNQFTVLGVGNSAPVEDGINETCTEENLTQDKFDVIQAGMSIDQIYQIVGCNGSYFSSNRYSDFSWTSPPPEYYSFRVIVIQPTPGKFIVSYLYDNLTFKSVGIGDLPLAPSDITGITNSAFDPATSVLTMESVWVTGGLKYENVAVHLDKFTLLGVAGETVVPPPPPPPPVNGGACGLDRFTAANFDAIQVGMSFDQVTQIMGCSPSRSDRFDGMVTHVWINLEVTQMFISVAFDESTMRATGNLGSAFKFWQGRSFVGQ